MCYRPRLYIFYFLPYTSVYILLCTKYHVGTTRQYLKVTAHALILNSCMNYKISDKESWLYRVFCSGGVNPKDPGNPRDNPDNAIMVWCRDSLGWALNQWYVKIMVLLVFAGYLAGALYGTTTIQEGLQRRKLSRADSYSIEFYDRDDFYFREFPYRIQVRKT